MRYFHLKRPRNYTQSHVLHLKTSFARPVVSSDNFRNKFFLSENLQCDKSKLEILAEDQAATRVSSKILDIRRSTHTRKDGRVTSSRSISGGTSSGNNTKVIHRCAWPSAQRRGCRKARDERDRDLADIHSTISELDELFITNDRVNREVERPITNRSFTNDLLQATLIRGARSMNSSYFPWSRVCGTHGLVNPLVLCSH